MLGERFFVMYFIRGDEQEALARAKDICLEQTVEFPATLVTDDVIKQHIIGRIESFEQHGSTGYNAVISFDAEICGCEFTQFLNVLFGNISIKPGIRVEKFDLPHGLLGLFKGPRFGRDGLRTFLGIQHRPLLFTALKPLGLSADRLASLAYQFASGGIDIIKDDHGIANQSFAPFAERVRSCAEAVAEANNKTGQNCIYVANITASPDEIFYRARTAKKNGAKGFLVSPGLVGLDTMRKIAEDDSLGLPVFSHPAFQGTFVLHADSGISHHVLFGQIARLAGADASIYPNFGGRFCFTKEECSSIANGTEIPMGAIKSIFPAPGGGMSLNRVPEMLEIYGNDVIFLIGGGLFTQGPDLIENCRLFRELVGRYEVCGRVVS
jgi:ribulose-bisphosphate carboxylase large chain